MRIKCYSVRLESMRLISDKAYKAVAYDGSEAYIPSCFVYGEDFEVVKSEAWWIAEWILERRGLQYSKKKCAWFDRDTGEKIPTVIYHNAERVKPKDKNIIDELKK